MKKILATSDWHINLKRTDDFLGSIDQIISFAQDYKPDLILHGGDVFDSRTPSNHLKREAAKRVAALCGIAPMVMVPGNHDLTNQGSTIDAWKELAPNNLHICTQPEVVWIDGQAIVALPWLTSRNVAEFRKSKQKEKIELGQAIDILLQAVTANLTDPILLAHASFVDAQMGQFKPAVLGNDLLWPSSWFEPFRWVVLGHFHKAQVLGKVIYPGSVERLSFNEMHEQKGFYTIDSQVTFHSLETRPMVMLEGTPEEINHRDVPDGAILKVRVRLEDGEIYRGFESSRFHSCIIKEIRPQRERSVRLPIHQLQGMTFDELLRLYFKSIGLKENRVEKLLLPRAREMLREVNPDESMPVLQGESV